MAKYENIIGGSVKARDRNIRTSEKDQQNGVPGLDSNGKVLESVLPDVIYDTELFRQKFTSDTIEIGISASSWNPVASGQVSIANGDFSGGKSAQYSIMVARNQTTDDTPTDLFLDGTSNVPQINPGRLISFEIDIVGVKTNSPDEGASWVHKFTGAIKNVNGSPSFVGTVTDHTIAEDTAASGWSASISGLNAELHPIVVGGTSSNINWVAVYKINEVEW
jgi:hypothetical protein